MNVFNMPINPDRWPIFKKVKNIGHLEPFRATNDMKEGDILVLNIVGSMEKEYYKRGVYGFATVVKEKYTLNDPNDSLYGEEVVCGKITHFKYDEPIIERMYYKKYIKNDRTPSMLEDKGKDYILNKISKIDENGNRIIENKNNDEELTQINEEKNTKKEIEMDEGDEEIIKCLEGRKNRKEINVYKRSKEIREKVIELHGTKCEVCGFDFEETYGGWGRGYIEVHHLEPISTWDGEKEPDPEGDFAVVCANCHRMIHRRRKETLSIKDLQIKILLKSKF